ncbi:MAG: sunset domain-containing protein [Actinomycetota bacterium]
MAQRGSRVVRRAVKRALGAGLVAGAGYAIWRAYRQRVPAAPPGSIEWESAPFPFPPVPRPKPETKRAAAWVEPNGEGTCPATHPVKAKLKSKIFHVPGGQNYDRTNPDRCYVDADAAESDGLRPSQR